jgi:short-subunit dehydrogenase
MTRTRCCDRALMAGVFITGSTDGLGYAAAKGLIDKGHDVALHARSRERASAVTISRHARPAVRLGP